jgi:AcrR family transcriptional regulator
MKISVKARDTKERILEAALKLFSKKGFLGATTKDIAKLAGVAELTLFRHFPSKERLFEGVITRYSFLEELKGLLPEVRQMEYRSAMMEISGKFLNRLSANRELIRIMHSERHMYPSKVKEIYQNFAGALYKTLADYFKLMQEAGILREFNPEYGAMAFLGMFFSYFNTRDFLLREDGPLDSERLRREFVDIFVDGTVRK